MMIPDLKEQVNYYYFYAFFRLVNNRVNYLNQNKNDRHCKNDRQYILWVVVGSAVHLHIVDDMEVSLLLSLYCL